MHSWPDRWQRLMHAQIDCRSNTFLKCDHFPVHKIDMLNFLSANDTANGIRHTTVLFTSLTVL